MKLGVNRAIFHNKQEGTVRRGSLLGLYCRALCLLHVIFPTVNVELSLSFRKINLQMIEQITCTQVIKSKQDEDMTIWKTALCKEGEAGAIVCGLQYDSTTVVALQVDATVWVLCARTGLETQFRMRVRLCDASGGVVLFTVSVHRQHHETHRS